MQNSTLLLHYSQSILSKMRVHGFLGKKNQNYAYLFCGNVDMLDSSKMEGKKNFFFVLREKNVFFFLFFFFVFFCFFFQKFDIIRGGVSKNPTRHKNFYNRSKHSRKWK